MIPPKFIYLASQSPRRRELLHQIGVDFRPLTIHVDETRKKGESPEDYVARLAEEKAVKGWESLSSGNRAPVLGADTVVVIDGEILGKPADVDEAGVMLAKLSDRTHEVLSAVCVTDGVPRSRMNRSRVTFRALTGVEREAYCATGEPMDKAGAYGIQGYAAVFVSGLEGSYSGVTGLPLFETAELLEEVGLRVLSAR